MKVETSKDPKTREPYGVRLIADTPEEDVIFERFWKGGVKINSRGHETLQFTFADLIERTKLK